MEELRLDDPIVIAALLLAAVADMFTIIGYGILFFPILGIPMFALIVVGANLLVALVLGIWFMIKAGAVSESLKLQKEMMSGVGGALAAGMEALGVGLSYVVLGTGLLAGLVLPVKGISLLLAVVLTNKTVQKAVELALQVGIAVGTAGAGAVVEAGAAVAAKEAAAIAAKEATEKVAVGAGARTAVVEGSEQAAAQGTEQGLGEKIGDGAKERLEEKAKDRLTSGEDAERGARLAEDFDKTDIDRLEESMEDLPQWGSDDVPPTDQGDEEEEERGRAA